MLANSLLLTATTAIAFLPSLVYAAPTAVYHEDGSVDIVADSTDDNGNVVKRNIKLDFTGCDDIQQADITGSWRSMLEMGDAIKDKVDFNEKVAKDFLGDPSRNKANQNDIRELIKSVVTWQLGGVFNWHLRMRCDDPNRKTKQAGQKFPVGCPDGALEQDFEKCASKCWVYRSGVWRTRAPAYTENVGLTNPVAEINWCPGWFRQETCNSRASKYSRYSDGEKLNMVNYQCREASMVHELFHIDSNWQHHAPGNGHIMDRKMFVKDSYRGQMVKVEAYGPLYTKVLARWAENDVGHYVATNADNLAYYFLGKWIQQTFGYYPNQPTTDEVPLSIPSKRDDSPNDPVDPIDPPIDTPIDTPNVWDPIRVVNGEVVLGDLNDLAVALGAESREEAQTLYDYDPDACLNLVAQGENDENPVCADADETVELDGNQELIPPVDPISPAP
ncbi:hypothetical protein ACHAPT_012827 [Fusarium lateritium]